jgi:hypothetical protein
MINNPKCDICLSEREREREIGRTSVYARGMRERERERENMEKQREIFKLALFPARILISREKSRGKFVDSKTPIDLGNISTLFFSRPPKTACTPIEVEIISPPGVAINTDPVSLPARFGRPSLFYYVVASVYKSSSVDREDGAERMNLRAVFGYLGTRQYLNRCSTRLFSR